MDSVERKNCLQPREPLKRAVEQGRSLYRRVWRRLLPANPAAMRPVHLRVLQLSCPFCWTSVWVQIKYIGDTASVKWTVRDTIGWTEGFRSASQGTCSCQKKSMPDTRLRRCRTLAVTKMGNEHFLLCEYMQIRPFIGIL